MWCIRSRQESVCCFVDCHRDYMDLQKSVRSNVANNYKLVKSIPIFF